MARLDNRVIIVTGAAQGIGQAYALGLAREGAALVALDILDCSETVGKIEAQGGRCHGIRADISSQEAADRMAGEALEKFGRIDVLVNNAAIFGGLKYKGFDEISEEEWDRMMAVNVRGIFVCSRAVIPQMKKQGKGKIVNISSGTVFLGIPKLLHYVTSKAAVIGFTRALAREMGEFGICVNALAPGYTMSPANFDKPKAISETNIANRCIKRDEYPEDLVGPMVYLCSDDSDFMTGQTIVVDGGTAMY